MNIHINFHLFLLTCGDTGARPHVHKPVTWLESEAGGEEARPLLPHHGVAPPTVLVSLTRGVDLTYVMIGDIDEADEAIRTHLVIMLSQGLIMIVERLLIHF